MDTSVLQNLILGFEKSTNAEGVHPLLVDRAYNLALNVLHRFFGRDWLKRHVIPTNNIQLDYFKASLDLNPGQFINTHRVIRVAELLFNLQDLPGFPRLLTSLKHDHRSTEAIVAELEAAAILHAAGIPFVFVEPTHGKGQDYDVEIRYTDGWAAAADIKCKIEGTALSTGTIRQAVDTARKQLPTAIPSFVLMKIPDAWANQEDFDLILEKGLSSALKQTRRITAIFVWWEEWIQLPGERWKRNSQLREEVNPIATFDAGPVRDLAKLTWGRAGEWTYLVQVVKETIDVPYDGSAVRVNYIP